ncbi:hypothetical protein STRTU_006869 [Streptomyces tubercidicus]|nr:hypothetical protein [Streptomyces tubercidicus]WAU16093.1 hypothetical protein STRTU_006869 [Streptomyces tubercidicus]
MSQRSASPSEVPEPDEDIREQVVGLAARLEVRINQLARLVVERQRAEVPGFDGLPGDMQDLEIASAARHTIRGFLRGVQGLADSDAEVLRERAIQRASEGVHLTGLLRAYHVATEVVMDALGAAARPGEEAALLWLTRRLITTVNSLVEEGTEAYLLGLADQQAAKRELAAALLGGDAPQEVAARCGLPLEPGYLVLSVRAPVPQEPVAARRLLHQVLVRLTPAADGRALSRRLPRLRPRPTPHGPGAQCPPQHRRQPPRPSRPTHRPGPAHHARRTALRRGPHPPPTR